MSGGFQGSDAGSGDVTAANILGDEFVIRGDGPGKGVQNSIVKLDDLGNFTNVNEITVSGLPMFKMAGHSITTSLVAGGQLVPNGGDTTKYDLTDGQGVIVNPFSDPNNPTFRPITWTGLIANIPAHAATFETFIAIEEIGTTGIGQIVEQSTGFSKDQGRDLIVIGIVSTPDGVNIGPIGGSSRSLGDGYLSTDLAEAIGNINVVGNLFGSGGADLTLSRSLGLTFRENINRFVNTKDPNFKPHSTDSGVSFFRIYNDGSGGSTFTTLQTSLDPDQYDDGSGTLAAMPGGNSWQNKVIYFAPDAEATIVQYGEETYSSFDDAVNAIATLEFTELNEDLTHDVVRSILTIKGGSTNLQADLLAGTAKFSPTGKFGFSIGSGGAGGGAGGTQDLQTTYNLSAPSEITTDGTRGAFTLVEGTADDTADVFEVIDGSAVKTFSIQGDGTLSTGKADGASASAFILNTPSTWTLGDILAVTNNGADMFKVSQFGQITGTNGSSEVFLDPFNGLVQFSPANSNPVRIGRGAGRELEISAPSGFEILIGANTAANGISMRPNAQTSDAQASKLAFKGGDARSTATTFIIGGTLFLDGGDGASGSAGLADGGPVIIQGGTGFGTGDGGDIVLEGGAASGSGVIGLIRLVNLPISDPGNDGVWDDGSGHVAIGSPA